MIFSKLWLCVLLHPFFWFTMRITDWSNHIVKTIIEHWVAYYTGWSSRSYSSSCKEKPRWSRWVLICTLQCDRYRQNCTTRQSMDGGSSDCLCLLPHEWCCQSWGLVRLQQGRIPKVIQLSLSCFAFICFYRLEYNK